MVIVAGVALAQTLTVPFFRDGATGARTTSAFIGIKDSSGNNQVITIVYSALDASGDPATETVTCALGANLGVQWQPVQDEDTEGPSQAVLNMAIGGKIAGSATISGTGLHGIR